MSVMYELLIDGSQTSPIQGIDKRLLELCQWLTMTPIKGPFTHKSKFGISGFLIIAESHIAYHWQNGKVTLDVFACKQFAAKSCFRYATRLFAIEGPAYTLLVRGEARKT